MHTARFKKRVQEACGWLYVEIKAQILSTWDHMKLRAIMCFAVPVYRWMDGWMRRYIRTNMCVERYKDRQIDRQIDRQTYR
jgi:hypothetical protein